ncbi:HEAT repeat [Desulfonauticus submarinus]|uniref:HEAT repeat n=1 Tax=Desulfonauticus submarinus TaxID=206665 RepID=A0A1H0CS52_9BACT|nr:HEAT repeat domain-containing protein [Desulfonauticus submarinus]SDN60694.1 HEAT repeat [Desulfonauticus submarinus]
MDYTKEKVLELLKSPNPEEQREGAFEAREMNLREAVPFLVPLLRSENVGVQEAADLALRKIGGKEVVGALIELLKDDDAALRNQAMDILRETGKDGIELLIPYLEDEDRDIRIFVADILGWSDSYKAITPLCNSLLTDKDPNVRYQAAVSLGLIGHKEAVECLAKALDDEEWVQFAVIEALVKIRDEDSIHILVERLDSSSELVASMIVEGIGELGFTKAVPLLAKKLEHVPQALKSKIFKALYKLLGKTSFQLFLEKNRQSYLSYLLETLEDEEEDTRKVAIIGLAKIGDERATKKLLDLAEQINVEHLVDTVHKEDVVDLLVESLTEIGPNSSLFEALFDDSPSRNLIAIRVLKQIGGAVAEEKLREVFWKKDRDIQREIALALEFICLPQTKELFLEVLDKHQDGDVLKAALRYFGKLKREEFVELLFKFLDHPWDDVKDTALDSLIQIGGDKVLKGFKNFFKDNDPLHRLMAIYAFGELRAEEYIDLVKEALEDEVVDIRKVALESLAKLCKKSQEVLDLVGSKLKDESNEVRLTLVELMSKCDHKDVVSYLVEALDDVDDWVKIRALEALIEKGEINEEITNKIISFLNYPNKIVVLKAIEALGELRTEKAFLSLLDMLEIDDYEIQDAVENALDKYQRDGEK